MPGAASKPGCASPQVPAETPVSTPLLMVEDDANVATTLAERLNANGFTVTAASSVAAADRAIGSEAFPIALLDVGLPDGSGFDVARLIRDRSPATAILFLTAYGTPEDRIHG